MGFVDSAPSVCPTPDRIDTEASIRFSRATPGIEPDLVLHASPRQASCVSRCATHSSCCTPTVTSATKYCEFARVKLNEGSNQIHLIGVLSGSPSFAPSAYRGALSSTVPHCAPDGTRTRDFHRDKVAHLPLCYESLCPGSG